MKIKLLFIGTLILVFALSSENSAKKPVLHLKTTDSLLVLGHFLFFDTHLSRNGTKSCASCHAPELAFTDGYRRSVGVEADLHRHNSPTLLNIADYRTVHWSDSTVKTVMQQLEHPFFATRPLELGLSRSDTTFLQYFNQNNRYRKLFLAAFRNDNGGNMPVKYTFQHLFLALSAYTKALKSENSPYDRYRRGDKKAIDSLAKKGEILFFKTLQCGTCHPYPSFTTATLTTDAYANIGLYRCYPTHDEGLFEVTKRSRDKGKFRIPTLRNVAITAPYMHDGSVRSLEEALTIFAAGGRQQRNDDGRKNPAKAKQLKPFHLDIEEKYALLSFLNSLTDTTFLKNSFFRNPF